MHLDWAWPTPEPSKFIRIIRMFEYTEVGYSEAYCRNFESFPETHVIVAKNVFATTTHILLSRI